MIRPVYCRTSGRRIGVCTCYRCQHPSTREDQR